MMSLQRTRSTTADEHDVGRRSDAGLDLDGWIDYGERSR
jgi:hypothetical protein